jgi:plasmid stabilization system protein ParE
MKIVWLQNASRSLDDSFEFLEALNPRAAAKVYNDILDELERLARMPMMAPIEQMLDDEPLAFRSLIARKRYKIIYFVKDETLFVADIWDCRQNPQTLKERVAEM